MFITLIHFSHCLPLTPCLIDLSPSNPVVFCHGLLGFDSVTIGPAIAPLEVTHWRGIKEVLEQNGTQVLITRVPATSSPVDRAKVLEQKISSVYPGKSVHLIGQFLSLLFYFSQYTFLHYSRSQHGLSSHSTNVISLLSYCYLIYKGWSRLSIPNYPPHKSKVYRPFHHHNRHPSSWIFLC